MFVRKIGNDYYVCKSKKVQLGRIVFLRKFKTDYLLRPRPGTGSILSARDIYFPKEFEGKRVRLKVEVLDD